MDLCADGVVDSEVCEFSLLWMPGGSSGGWFYLVLPFRHGGDVAVRSSKKIVVVDLDRQDQCLKSFNRESQTLYLLFDCGCDVLVKGGGQSVVTHLFR